MRYRSTFSFVASLVLAIGVAPAAAEEPPAGSYAAWIGKEAPAFRLTSVDGKKVALSDYHGNLVVIHFGASWCPFCNAEAPHLESLWKAYRQRGVQVLVVDVGEPRETVRKWAAESGVTFPVLLDGDGKAARAWAPDGAQRDLPRDRVAIASNAIVDRKGKLVFFTLLDSARFDARLASLTARLDDLLKDTGQGPPNSGRP